MVKHLLYLFVIAWVILPAAAQQPVNKSSGELLLQLQKSTQDTSRVNLLLQLSEYYFYKKERKTKYLDSSLLHARSAEALSKVLNYQKGIGNSYEQISKVFHFQNDTAGGKYYAKKAIEIFKANNYQLELGYAYYDLSGYYSLEENNDLAERIRFVEQFALPAFERSGSKLKEADILKELGDLQQIKGDYSKALSNLVRASKLYQTIDHPDLQGVYNLMGGIYSVIGNNDQALKYGLLAMSAAESVRDTSMQLATTYNRIGATYRRMGKYQLSYEYLKKSLTVARKYNDTETIVLLTSNISRVLISLNEPQKALAMLQEVHQKYPIKDLYLQLYITASFLITYEKLKQYKEAQKYCDQLLFLSKKLDKNDPDQSEVQYPVTEFYLATHQYDLARKRIAITDTFYKSIQSPLELSKNHLLWFKLDSLQGNYLSAISHYEQYKALSDSLTNEATNKRTEQLQIEYETEKKDQDIKLKDQNIELLTKKDQLQQSTLRQAATTRNMILGGTALLILFLALNYNRYRIKQKINKQLEQQQKEINEKNTSLEHLVEEKEWLVKEIHHRVKNNLQIVMSLMNIQSNYLENPAALEAIKESQSRMNAMSLIHQKLYQSDSLVSIDMSKYIAELSTYLMEGFGENKQIEIITDVANVELDASQAVPIGLILNEAITNSIKYAFVKSNDGIIKISLRPFEENKWQLVIADNGKGLSAKFDFKKSNSIGMALIETLTEQIGGTLQFHNKEGLEIRIIFVKALPVSTPLELN